jgi:peptide/nickel transport system permease protein
VIGSLLVSSIIAGDLVMVQGTVLFIALVYVIVNTVVDLAYGFLDPRVRVGRA